MISFLEVNITGDFTDNVFEYILMSYLQVENLYEKYTHEELTELHNEFLAYKEHHPEFRIDQFFMDGGYALVVLQFSDTIPTRGRCYKD